VREDKDIEDDEDLITREPDLLMTTWLGERNADRTAQDSDGDPVGHQITILSLSLGRFPIQLGLLTNGT